MAQRTAKRKRNSPGRRDLKPVVLVVLAALLVLAVLPAASRWWWRRGERSEIGDAVAAVNGHGCMSCHRAADGMVRWRAYGETPDSLDNVRDALTLGRSEAPGFAVPMPPYGDLLGHATIDRLALGVGVYSGLVASTRDPELEVGRDIAAEMGCFGCHGPLGSGGAINPGSALGSVPGFWGAAFRDARRAPGGLARTIREGGVAGGAWWMPWRRPMLAMPAYGDRLDSTELELLLAYLEWLVDHDVNTGEFRSYDHAGGSG